MSDYFPQEILLEILHRLPPKFLVKCTIVCKSWRSLITNPSFIYLHLRHSHSFLLLQLCNERTHPNLVNYSLRRDDPFLTDSSSALRLPSSFEREFSVVGIRDGLVCITSGEDCYALFICNPCVRRYVSLPKPRDYPCLFNANVGFGFDSQTSDYKVVRVSCMLDDERYGLSSPEVEVYSLATGFWRNLDPGVAPVCCLCFVGGDAPHGFVDGVVHWGAKRWVEGSPYLVLQSPDLVAAFNQIRRWRCWFLPAVVDDFLTEAMACSGGGWQWWMVVINENGGGRIWLLLSNRSAGGGGSSSSGWFR